MSDTISNHDVDLTYLNSLMRFANRQRLASKFIELDPSTCTVSYLSTRGSSSFVLKEGYRDFNERQQKLLKETNKLRAGAKNYARITKNEAGHILQVDNYKNGVNDCIYQVQYINNNRYLFPFFPDKSLDPDGPIYVTKYRDNRVTEELVVDNKHLIYEGYSHLKNKGIDYLYINYEPNGHYPIRELVGGIFSTDPLVYHEFGFQCWLRDLPPRKSTP